MNPVWQRKVRNIGAEMVNHYGDDRERSKTVKLRLITLRRLLATQGLIRRSTCHRLAPPD
jgi:hypothetical protein